MADVSLYRLKPVLVFLLLGASCAAEAHIVHAPVASDLLSRWTFEPWVVLCLLLSLALYLIGIARLKAKGRLSRTMLKQSGFFIGGWLVLAVALLSPIDVLGAKLFWVHMVQHEIMMLLAAPLLVLGKPFGPWLWAMPMAVRTNVAAIAQSRWASVPWRILTLPLGAWLLHAAAIWLWHSPALFNAALLDNGVHSFQHLSFLISALFFWWSIFNTLASRKTGAAVLSLFSTMLHTGALGALLTFSAIPWYGAYKNSAFMFGLDPLSDQQMGGLIMWIPGGLVFIAVSLGLGARWLTTDAKFRKSATMRHALSQ